MGGGGVGNLMKSSDYFCDQLILQRGSYCFFREGGGVLGPNEVHTSIPYGNLFRGVCGEEASDHQIILQRRVLQLLAEGVC